MDNQHKQAHACARSLDKVYPAGVRWDIPIPDIDLPSLIDSAITQYADNTAIHFLGRKITYRELGELIDRTAAGLQQAGIRRGTTVGLYMPNTPYYPIMFLAALKAGAHVVNYNTQFTQRELADQIADSDTDMLVTVDLEQFHNNALSLQENGELDRVVACPFSAMLPFSKKVGLKALNHFGMASDKQKLDPRSTANTGTPTPSDSYIGFNSLINHSARFRHVPLDPQDTALLQYTGGTTGTPKGAILSHFNLVANVTQNEAFVFTGRDKPDNGKLMQPGQEKVLAALPYFHVFGMMVSMISALRGGEELIILPDPKDIKTTLKTIHTEQPRVIPAVPRMLDAIAQDRNRDHYNLDSIGLVLTGGEALSEDVRHRFEHAVGRDNIVFQGYGLSETSPVATFSHPLKNNKANASGHALPRTQIRINDPATGAPLSRGQRGEVYIKGPQVMHGYYNKPGETADVLSGDGWYRTGDIGYIDDEDYLFIVDRKKRMININGENIYPLQIEEALLQHPSIAEAGVIGTQTENGSEAAKAFIHFNVSAQAADTPGQDDIRAFLGERLHKLEIPRFIEFRDSPLPKTSVGKLDFKALEAEDKQRHQAPRHAGLAPDS